MDKYKIGDEDQILLVRVLKSEEPYFWYASKIGQKLKVIDFRYQNKYKSIYPFTGYIDKGCCEIVEILEKRKVPDFPFMVKITKNSWFPECWYAKHVGEIFEITSGTLASGWVTKVPNGNDGWIRKEDCEIIK